MMKFEYGNCLSFDILSDITLPKTMQKSQTLIMGIKLSSNRQALNVRRGIFALHDCKILFGKF